MVRDRPSCLPLERGRSDCTMPAIVFTVPGNSTLITSPRPGEDRAARDRCYIERIKAPHCRRLMAGLEGARGHMAQDTGDGFLGYWSDAEHLYTLARRRAPPGRPRRPGRRAQPTRLGLPPAGAMDGGRGGPTREPGPLAGRR